jgi:Caspase domain
MRLRIAIPVLWIGLLTLSAQPSASQSPVKDTRDLRVEPMPGTVNTLPSSDRRWALLVGVDQYQDKQITSLTGAAADAHALADALVKYAGFDPQHVIVLATDLPPERQPTKGNILVRLSNISSLVPKDGLLLFSFAGHGIERNGEAFLLSADAKVSNDIRVVQETTIGARHIKNWIQDMGIKQVLMLMDACRNDPMAGRSETPNRMAESYRKAFMFDVQNHDVEAFATLYATRVGERAYLNSEKGTRLLHLGPARRTAGRGSECRRRRHARKLAAVCAGHRAEGGKGRLGLRRGPAALRRGRGLSRRGTGAVEGDRTRPHRSSRRQRPCHGIGTVGVDRQ